LNHARKTVHETLDGETIVIHLDSGSYYSLTGSGSEIWALLGTGGSVADICNELARRHARSESEIRADVDNFIAELEREALVECDGAPTTALAAPTVVAIGTWEPPRLERYDDMRDFLMVDPIHEVDETGWPHRAAS
jgi:Coenzyme PQQ synthesis protein D (PqqD)